MKRTFGMVWVAIFVAIACSTILAANAASTGTSSKSGDKSSSKDTSTDTGSGAKAANGPSAAASNSSAGSGGTSDLSSWIVYGALAKIEPTLKAEFAKTSCSSFTWTSAADRRKAAALVAQVEEETSGIHDAVCSEAAKLSGGAKACSAPTHKSLTAVVAGAAAVASSLQTITQFIQSLQPTYDVKVSAASVDPIALQRSVSRALDPTKIIGISVTEGDASKRFRAALADIGNAKTVLEEYSSSHQPAGDPTATTDDKTEAKKKSEAAPSGAVAANVKLADALAKQADDFLSAVLDPTKTTVSDFEIADATSTIDTSACSVQVAAHAGATMFTQKKSLLSSNSFLEGGALVLSYEVDAPDGRMKSVGIAIASCEVESKYSMGDGAPPDPAKLVCHVQ